MDDTPADEAERATAAPPRPAPDTSGQAAPQTVRLDESKAQAAYANFCRVSSTPEEMILDLGLNPHPFASGEVVVPVTQRIVMNHYTAKRLLSALGTAVGRHEQAFGMLETDVRKRVRPG